MDDDECDIEAARFAGLDFGVPSAWERDEYGRVLLVEGYECMGFIMEAKGSDIDGGGGGWSQ